MASFEVNGRAVGYSVHGEGPAVLTFHGTTQAGNAWDQVRELSSTPHTWVNFEFPGSGESSMPTAPIQLDDMVNDAFTLMTHLGHDLFHVVGYSLGAVTALRTAAMKPERVLSVTSLCGWSQSDARMRITFDLWRRLIAVSPELFMRYALADGYTVNTLSVLEPMVDGAAAMAAATVQPGSDAHLDLDIRVDIEEHLSNIACPCLVIGGIEDRWVDIKNSRHLASVISGAQLVELPAGHLVIGELAADIAKLIDTHTA